MTKKKNGKKSAVPKKKILFVCTGNTCRSPMAEILFRYILGKKHKLSLYDVASAGLSVEEGAPMTETAYRALQTLGVPVKRPHKAKQLTYEIAETADFIVCMTASHKNALLSLGDKVKTVGEITGGTDVPDPFGGNLDIYLKTAQYLLYACEDIFAWVAPQDAARQIL